MPRGRDETSCEMVVGTCDETVIVPLSRTRWPCALMKTNLPDSPFCALKVTWSRSEAGLGVT